MDRSIFRQAFSGSVLRLIGLPIVAIAGIANTSLVVANTGIAAYGIVNTVAMLGALLPFSDLGVGGTVTTAVALDSVAPRAGLKHKLKAAYFVLIAVAFFIVITASMMGMFALWSPLLGQDLSVSDNRIISVGVSVFGLAVPLGLGVRILIGLGRNDLAVAIAMTSSIFSLAFTAVMALAGGHGMIFSLTSFLGLFSAGLISTFLAHHLLRKGAPTRDASQTLLGSKPIRRYDFRALSGSGALIIITIGLPLGLETGRILLSRTGSPMMLSQYALMAQLYAITWSVLSTASGALWTIFAQRRADPNGSIAIWRWMVVSFGLLSAFGAAFLWALAPWAGSVISHGEILIPPVLAMSFGALLIAQSLHLPAGSLLTTPRQLWVQAVCVLVMAALSLSVGLLLARTMGGAGFALGAATGVLVGQFLPDLLLVPRLVLEGTVRRKSRKYPGQRLVPVNYRGHRE
ncbi:hypothetical protein [Cryobacterium sp. TMT2-14]|uniref:hypothetical protein n=1 Tax=Cryobacterium sp. TMT2-14 TaxID=1259245 RepID=UPI00106CD559|nr:hypothetical protein [Cryobacterium sp. TMT2-14]TFC33843.1 hypothetical protein E3O28_13195 [Cryobacterium sp. TMT2-14]